MYLKWLPTAFPNRKMTSILENCVTRVMLMTILETVNRAKRKRLEQEDNEDHISSTTSSSNTEGSSSECSLLRGRWAWIYKRKWGPGLGQWLSGRGRKRGAKDTTWKNSGYGKKPDCTISGLHNWNVRLSWLGLLLIPLYLINPLLTVVNLPH